TGYCSRVCLVEKTYHDVGGCRKHFSSHRCKMCQGEANTLQPRPRFTPDVHAHTPYSLGHRIGFRVMASQGKKSNRPPAVPEIPAEIDGHAFRPTATQRGNYHQDTMCAGLCV